MLDVHCPLSIFINIRVINIPSSRSSLFISGSSAAVCSAVGSCCGWWRHSDPCHQSGTRSASIIQNHLRAPDYSVRLILPIVRNHTERTDPSGFPLHRSQAAVRPSGQPGDPRIRCWFPGASLLHHKAILVLLRRRRRAQLGHRVLSPWGERRWSHDGQLLCADARQLCLHHQLLGR